MFEIPVTLAAYFTAPDELAAVRLRRALRRDGWAIDWSEEGEEGPMLRASKQVPRDDLADEEAAAAQAAAAAGATFACTEVEQAPA